MGILDSLLAQVSSNVDIANLASKVGLTPDQVEAAVQAIRAMRDEGVSVRALQDYHATSTH